MARLSSITCFLALFATSANAFAPVAFPTRTVSNVL